MQLRVNITRGMKFTHFPHRSRGGSLFFTSPYTPLPFTAKSFTNLAKSSSSPKSSNSLKTSKDPTTTESSDGNKSSRQEFMKIKPDIKILDHLDYLGLGYVAKRRARRAIATKYEKELPGVQSQVRISQNLKKKDISTFANTSPYPFNKGPRKVQKIMTAKTWEEIPNFGESVPEIAIIGRSNVGKSTLLNALLGYTSSHVQKAVVSNKPGETKALQFFTLGRNISTKVPTLVITDMPGYGFAFLNVADAKRCFYLSSQYLRSRGKNLKRVLLLIDARHGFKRTDLQCFQDLVTMTYSGPEEAPSVNTDLTGDDDDDSDSDEINDLNDMKGKNKNNIQKKRSEDLKAKNKEKKMEEKKREENENVQLLWKLQIILTKCDLVERSELARRVQLMRQELADSFPFKTTNMPIIMLSAIENRGIIELHRELASLVPPEASGNVSSASGHTQEEEEDVELK